MCNCDKKNKTKIYQPLFRQALVRDRLNRIVVVKVPIQPRRKKRIIVPPKSLSLEDEIKKALK
jgi:hypothetical protein